MEQILKKEMHASKPVSDEIRVLAQDDLMRSIIHSNRELVQLHHLHTGMLKSPAQIKKLVNNTEESIFIYNGADIQKYVESMLTLIIFLSDFNVSKDSTLFRFLLNCDINDLYIDPSSVEILFSELLYSDIRSSTKQQILEKITAGISKCIPYMLYDYMNNQSYIHINTVQYTIPKEVRHKIKRYRDYHLPTILSQLKLNNESNNTDDGSIYSAISSSAKSIIGLFSGGESSASSSKTSVHNDAEDYDSDFSSIPDSMVSGIDNLYGDDESSESVSSRKSWDEVESRHSSNRSTASIGLDILYPTSNTESDSDSSSNSSKSDSSNSVLHSSSSSESNWSSESTNDKCYQCTEVQADSNYQTIHLTTHPKIVKFCNKDCMEKWEP